MRKYRFLLGIFAVIFVIGCNDNNPEISEGLFGKDKMKVIKDSITAIDAFTVSDANAITSPVTLGLVGVHNDDAFGKTKAGCAFQLRTGRQYIFDETAEVDSVFLYLLYDKAYYDSTFVQNMNIYQLTGSGLDFTDKYRADEISRISFGDPIVEKDFNFSAIADTLIKFNRFDTIWSKKDSNKDSLVITVNDTLVSDFLKIQLPNEFAQKVFIDDATPNDYESQENFRSYFKGLYVDSDDITEEGGLFAFNISEGNSTSAGVSRYTFLNVIYSYEADTGKVSNLGVGFYTGENSARVNFMTHDYTGSEVANVIGERGEVEESDVLYIKGAAGTSAKLYIDELNNWKDSSDIAINKAELVLTVATDSLYNVENPVPDKLVMAAIDKDNNTVVIPDYSLPTFDGKYDKDENTYRFNISFYLQKIIQDKGETLNNGFLIFPSNRRSDPRGVKIANPQNANEKDKRIKLSITYTKIK